MWGMKDANIPDVEELIPGRNYFRLVIENATMEKIKHSIDQRDWLDDPKQAVSEKMKKRWVLHFLALGSRWVNDEK